MDQMDIVIERQVLDELGSRHGMHAESLHVNVTGGIVKLSGQVTSFAESSAAEQATFGVGGVVDVINALSVLAPGGPPKSDVEVARAVRHALVWNVLVPDDVISFSVTDGVVRLHGIVEDASEREEAEQSIGHLVGVRQVHNLLSVRAKEEVIRDVKQAIVTALDQQAHTEGDRIRVEAHEGRVTLTGCVHCAVERQAALRAAASAPGVRAVEDHLHIEGQP